MTDTLLSHHSAASLVRGGSQRVKILRNSYGFFSIHTHERCFMIQRALTVPEIMLIAGTRIALGAGLGLLLSDKLSRDARKGAGWALLAVGGLSSIPLVLNVLGKP